MCICLGSMVLYCSHSEQLSTEGMCFISALDQQTVSVESFFPIEMSNLIIQYQLELSNKMC